MPEIASLVILIFSIIIHEVAHGYAANSLGDPTARLSNRLTLNPIPHIDPIGSVAIPALLIFSSSPILFGWAKPVPYNPYNLRNQRWGEALVAVAGSATNLLIAVIFGLVIRFGSALGLSEAALTLAVSVVFVNVFLGLFNLIPFPPLDGFTTLRAALPWNLSRQLSSLEASVRGSGLLALIGFLFVFSYFFSGPFFRLVSAIVYFLIGASQ
jgi:Zn-dependent protease